MEGLGSRRAWALRLATGPGLKWRLGDRGFARACRGDGGHRRPVACCSGERPNDRIGRAQQARVRRAPCTDRGAVRADSVRLGWDARCTSDPALCRRLRLHRRFNRVALAQRVSGCSASRSLGGARVPPRARAHGRGTERARRELPRACAREAVPPDLPGADSRSRRGRVRGVARPRTRGAVAVPAARLLIHVARPRE